MLIIKEYFFDEFFFCFQKEKKNIAKQFENIPGQMIQMNGLHFFWRPQFFQKKKRFFCSGIWRKNRQILRKSTKSDFGLNLGFTNTSKLRWKRENLKNLFRSANIYSGNFLGFLEKIGQFFGFWNQFFDFFRHNLAIFWFFKAIFSFFQTQSGNFLGFGINDPVRK